jgi:hypothetical protein
MSWPEKTRAAATTEQAGAVKLVKAAMGGKLHRSFRQCAWKAESL